MCDHHTRGATKAVTEGEEESYQESSSPSDRDSEKGLLTGSLPQESDRCCPRAGRWSLRSSAWTIWITCFNVMVLCGSVLFLMSPLSSQACLQHLSTQDKWKATSAYAPILERFDIPRVDRITNGSLYDSEPPSILRIPQGDEADDEWFRISSGVFPILISAEEIRRLGKDPSLAVRVPDEFGFGPDAYLAQTEVFHLLHCLDMLRKEISYEHYYFPKFGNRPDAQHTAHITHCIDILAQYIKCESPVDVILFNWVGGWDQPFPDFMNKHVCRDYEALLEYVNENSVPKEVFRAMKKPPPDYPVQPDPSIAPFLPTGVAG
ncbi:oxidase ustYa family protein [Aspergillus candidus]|uniref:Tat pathway signal sequence n=1 Tax=Aspergillus candidus TaxID=41067 RepID=A0A2I2FEA0_ASPCN|nr:hypothetical protein BDW47DRAFT_131082 [Aspergillus candidus]PLB38961.1 hypothetical protein BDW47DRAFT_131082 [Aspergillus candidus]